MLFSHKSHHGNHGSEERFFGIQYNRLGQSLKLLQIHSANHTGGLIIQECGHGQFIGWINFQAGKNFWFEIS